ncbi:MAG: hypothetical protein R2932_16620 [Caldilineaceae bacterium]
MKQQWQRVGLLLTVLMMLLAPSLAYAQSPSIEFKIALRMGNTMFTCDQAMWRPI